MNNAVIGLLCIGPVIDPDIKRPVIDPDIKRHARHTNKTNVMTFQRTEYL